MWSEEERRGNRRRKKNEWSDVECGRLKRSKKNE